MLVLTLSSAAFETCHQNNLNNRSRSLADGMMIALANANTLALKL